MNLKELANPFPETDITWRIQHAGKKNGKLWARVLAYVTNRAIMERLDQVVGPGNWQNQFREWQGTAQLCGISIHIADEWVTKWDGAGQTDIESIKGGLSDSMKRAAVQWGIGRYLYNMPKTIWANIHENGKYPGVLKDGEKKEWFNWDPPPLTAQFLPSGSPPKSPEEPPSPPAPPAPSQLAQATADIQAAGKIDDVVKWLAKFRQKLSSDELATLHTKAALRIHELCRRMADDLPDAEQVAARQANVMALFSGKLLWLSDKQTEIRILFEDRIKAINQPVEPPT